MVPFAGLVDFTRGTSTTTVFFALGLGFAFGFAARFLRGSSSPFQSSSSSCTTFFFAFGLDFGGLPSTAAPSSLGWRLRLLDSFDDEEGKGLEGVPEASDEDAKKRGDCIDVSATSWTVCVLLLPRSPSSSSLKAAASAKARFLFREAGRGEGGGELS